MSTSAIRPDPFDHAAPPQAPGPVTPRPAPEPTETPEAELSENALDQAAMEPSPAERRHPVQLSIMDRVEAFIARLSTRNHFWHRVCSLVWLPYAFKSGIRQVKQVSEYSFTAVLPFRRFNRNWYNAMAGAALLANSEIAGGMFIFGITGGDYTIVCKNLEYKFLRPCLGPAIYNVVPREDIKALIASGKEFNATLDLEIVQQAVVPEAIAKLKKKDMLLAKMASKQRRVGKCVATFHVTPTLHQKAKRGDTRKVS
jgi:hypothetical protein